MCKKGSAFYPPCQNGGQYGLSVIIAASFGVRGVIGIMNKVKK